MCNTVIDGHRAATTPAELAELIGAENLVWQDHNPFSRWPAGEDWHRLDLCLCPIDLKQTLEKAGLVYRRGVDPMECFIVRTTELQDDKPAEVSRPWARRIGWAAGTVVGHALRLIILFVAAVLVVWAAREILDI